MALSLYRKYRPNVFADVVGQEHVERTLVNAVSDGTTAHAYLFCGPRGTGKTTTARLLAKALLCEHVQAGQPDGTCAQCEAIAQGTHPDVYELDAASRTGVDNVREEIISRVQFAPTRGACKIYIIDEIHMLSTAAFNALLKTLEEPPDHVVFVLCTTDPHKVPETIQSRCQRFDFKRLSVEQIISYLTRVCEGEGFAFEERALEFIASRARGGMRDATTSLEQAAVYAGGNITYEKTAEMFGQVDVSGLFELAGLIARRDTAACFRWLDAFVARGVDLTQFARDFARHMRNLYVTALTGGADGIVPCTSTELESYREQAHTFGSPERLSRALEVCGRLVSELRHASDARLSIEIALVRLCRPQSELTLESLEERLAELERRGVAGGAQATAGQTGAQASAPTMSTSEPWAGSETPDTGEPWAGALECAPTTETPQAASEPQARAEAPSAAEPRAGADAERGAEGSPAVGSEPRADAGQAGALECAPTTETPQSANEPQARAEAPSAVEPRAGADAERGAEGSPTTVSEPQVHVEEPDEARPQALAQAAPAMSIERLRAGILSVVRREDVAVSALLESITLQEGEDSYYLTFPADGGDFLMQAALSSGAQGLLQKAFKEMLGIDARFQLRVGKPGVAAAYDPQPGAAQPPQQVGDIFGNDSSFDDAGYDADYDASLDAYADSMGYAGDDGYAGSYDAPNGGMSGSYGGFDPDDDDFGAAPAGRPFVPDDEATANIADMLSAFGEGVKVREVPSDQ